VTGPTRVRGPTGEGGQAAVELALVLPLLALAGLAVLQVALVARDQVLVVHAAREGARQAAVDASPEAARRGALAGAALDPSRTEVEASGRAGAGSRVTVRVRYRSPTDVPLVGGLVPELVLGADATMRVERGQLGAIRTR
jgi:Flp pilus assembly protein TadG